MSKLLELKNLNVTYPNGVKALENINLSLPVGKRIVILGPNGAGKSTLIKAILQLQSYSASQITLFNKSHNLKDIIKTKIAYIPQHTNINTQFPTTIFDIVLMGRYPYIHNWLKRPTQTDKKITLKALDQMQLTHLQDRHITQLSGGQQQRTFIARALVQEADLFIMDEPLSSVDIQTEEIIMNTLKNFQKQNKTSIVIHHDLNTVTKYFDYVVWINKTIISHGPIEKEFTHENYQKTFQQNLPIFHETKQL